MARLADPELATRRRREILDAAMFCFRRRGFHQATMQEICAEAGLSPGALYRYFDSKSDIIAAIAEDASHHADLVLQRVHTRNELIDVLCAFARGLFDKMQGEGSALLADIYAEGARDPLLAKSLGVIGAKAAERSAAVISALQAAGEIDPELDPMHASNVLFACIDGLGFRQMVAGAADVEDAVAQFRVLATRYLAKRS